MYNYLVDYDLLKAIMTKLLRRGLLSQMFSYFKACFYTSTKSGTSDM